MRGNSIGFSEEIKKYCKKCDIYACLSDNNPLPDVLYLGLFKRQEYYEKDPKPGQ